MSRYILESEHDSFARLNPAAVACLRRAAKRLVDHAHTILVLLVVKLASKKHTMLQAYVLFKTRPMVAVLILALLMWSFGLPSWIASAQAANVGNFSDTLSNSAPGEDATHTLEFTLVNAVSAGESILITFDPETSAFDASAITEDDLVFTTDPGGAIPVRDQLSSCTASRNAYLSSVTADEVEITMCPDVSSAIDAGDVVTIVVGDDGGNQVINPTDVQSYVIRLGGTMTDSGDTRVAIVDLVTVTAVVETIFDFSVHGLDTTDMFTGEVVTGSTTATSIPFGIISPGDEYFLMQELRVDTNAYNGFTVTVESDQTLTAGNGAEISEFIDGAETAAATNWQSPDNTFGSPDTYGHWGITSNDPTTGPGNEDFVGGGPNYVGNFVNNPVPVFYHDVAASYSVDPSLGESFTYVGYKVEIGTLQEAGNDYQATIMYIATPVF